MKPNVSIGVCVKNVEDFIEDAIDSIIKQDYPHRYLDVIFVDDGSEDNTLLIIKKKVEKIDIPFKIIHTSWNGIGHARNIVVTNAGGDYILWVDGDMVLSKDYTRTLVEFMEKHQKVGIVKGKQSLKPEGNLLAILETYSRAAGKMIDYQSEKARTKSLGTGGSLYRKNIIQQVGGFDENLKRYGEDFDLEIRIRNAGWSLSTTYAKCLDYERRGITWKTLWIKYWIRGFYSHYFLHKNIGMIVHYRMFPPAAFLVGLLQANKLFRLTRDKAVFLLPFHNFLKMFVWYMGYIKAHFLSYQPKL